LAVVYSPDDPIAALATAAVSSALAVIRVSGPGSLSLLSGLVKGGRDAARMKGHTIHRLVLHDGGEDVDEVLLAVYKAPRSYTGQDSAEIFCHGGLPVIQRVMSLLTRCGFRPAGPGEFTQRAFLNGRMDLTRAEAVNEIVRAKTDKARALALQRLSGAVEKRIRAARDALVELRAALEVMIDFPEDEPGDVIDDGKLRATVGMLESLTGTYRRGRIYQEGVAVVIAGATNSGKSSLFNLLLRQERAIVSEIHGTTRDWLEGMVSLSGIPVRLFDTAGLRPSSDPLEIEGIRRTEEVIRAADAVVYLVDGSRGVAAEDREFTDDRRAAAPLLPVWNKIDLPGVPPAPAGYIAVSAATGQGLDALEKAVAEAVLGGPTLESGEPLIDSQRQKDLIQRALAALARFGEARSRGITPDLLAVDLSDALDALGEITGEVTSAEVLDRMFSAFCVGK
jgi:tRNA modification GTPase